MSDVELSELVKRFQALQKDNVADQITERNVVEIVNTLIKKKLVDLLYTTDAKEYMTWDELKREIVEEVHANGGRVNVVDIPGLLSVHTYHVERVLPDILATDPTLHLEGGELMTDAYLAATVQAAAEVLKEQGSLPIAQFVTKYQFTSAFAMKLLMDAVQDGRLAAVIQDSALYTKQFVRSQRIILRSALLAAEQPVDIEDVYKRHKLFVPLMDTLIDQLAAELPGNFQGHVFTPKVYESFRTEQVHNIYGSNGVVPYAALHSMGLGNAKQYLVSRYNPGTENATSDTNTSAAATTGGGRRGGGKRRGAGGKTSALHGGGSSVPIVRADDAHPHCGYPLSACFLSDRSLINLVGLNPLLEGEALALDVASLFPVGVDLSSDWSVLVPRLTELYPGLAECELIEDTVLVRKDAEEKVRPQLYEALRAIPPSTKKGSKKGGGGGGGSGTGITQTAVVEVVGKILQLPVEQYGAVLQELVGQWDSTVSAVMQQIEASMRDSASADLKHSRASLQSSLTSAWVELGIVAKGLQWAKAQFDETAYTALCRHALTTRGLAICRDVILNESLDDPELHTKVEAALEQATTLGNFKKCIAPFPEKTRDALAPIAAALNDKELERLMDTLQEMSGSGVIAVSSFYSPNKKVEREANTKMKETVRGHVERAAFSASVAENGTLFATLVTFVVSNLFRVYLEIPGKAVGAVVSRVVKESDAPAALAEALDIVTSTLQGGDITSEQISSLDAFRTGLLA